MGGTRRRRTSQLQSGLAQNNTKLQIFTSVQTSGQRPISSKVTQTIALSLRTFSTLLQYNLRVALHTLFHHSKNASTTTFVRESKKALIRSQCGNGPSKEKGPGWIQVFGGTNPRRTPWLEVSLAKTKNKLQIFTAVRTLTSKRTTKKRNAPWITVKREAHVQAATTLGIAQRAPVEQI